MYLNTQFIFSNLNESPLVENFKNIFIGHPNTNIKKNMMFLFQLKHLELTSME